MGLSSKFDRNDVETLIEALGDWEMSGNHDYAFMQAVEDAPMPPEDNEAYDIVVRMKDYYRERKQNILDHRAARQETAVFLKAKLMMVRKAMGISDLFNMETETEAIPVAPIPVAPVAPVPVVPDSKPIAAVPTSLELAEFFIKDLGVWDHYQKFLVDKQENS